MSVLKRFKTYSRMGGGFCKFRAKIGPEGLHVSMIQVERCFGMLVSPGRNVRHSDMQLLEGVRMIPAGAGWTIQVIVQRSDLINVISS